MSDLRERVDSMLAWARNRIEQCRREEFKFAQLRPGPRTQPYPCVVLEAVAERRALQAVIEQIAAGPTTSGRDGVADGDPPGEAGEGE